MKADLEVLLIEGADLEVLILLIEGADLEVLILLIEGGSGVSKPCNQSLRCSAGGEVW